MDYPVKLAKDDNDTILVSSVDFPELITFGDDREDALSHASDALEEAVAARIAANEDIPHPSKGRTRARLSLLTSIKVSLYQEMRAQNVSKAELARRMGLPRQSSDRLVNVMHRSSVDQIERALKAIDRYVDVEVHAPWHGAATKPRRLQA